MSRGLTISCGGWRVCRRRGAPSVTDATQPTVVLPVLHAAPPEVRPPRSPGCVSVRGGVCQASAMDAAGRQYGGKSHADRRAERRDQLLSAAFALIGDGGIAAVRVRSVCAAAGLTPRYFYEEFGTVDELARELFDREFGVGLMRVGEAVLAAGAQPNDRVDAAVGAVLDLFAEEPRRVALLLTEATGTGVLAARREERMTDAVAVLASFGRSTYGDGVEPPDAAAQAEADRAVAVAATFVAGGLTFAIESWCRGTMPGTRAALQRDLAAQIVAVGDAAFAELQRPAI
jgi:AcrR family transcriptional regulator